MPALPACGSLASMSTFASLDAFAMFRSLLLACGLVLAACASQAPIGPIHPAELRAAAPAFARSETAPADEVAALQQALTKHGPAEVTVYFADWCHDSVRELPRLLALVEAQAPERLKLQLINLDHDKRDPAGRAEAAGITRTPTIVVQRNGRELGRIVERPQLTVGQDLIALLNQGS